MVVIMIILAALPLILLVSALKDGMEIMGSIYGIRKYFLGSSDTLRYRRYIESFGYYKLLSNEGKEVFFKRLMKFMFSKSFTGKKGLEVTDEMKVLISASAIQLTYGLKRFKLENLDTIHIYPETFYFGPDRLEYKGATSQGGSMYLSWEDFKDGYLHPTDRYNLGLHEMSHALKLDVFMSSRFDAHFGSYLDEWLEVASTEFDRMKHGSPSFLRSYAKTNKHEFFAVCVEHFFECPEEFRKALPDVYNHLVILLNQDPLNSKGDYSISESFTHVVNKDPNNTPLPKEVRKNFKYSSWHWSLNVLFVGIPAAGFTFFYMGRSIVLPWEGLLAIFLACGAIGLMQWDHFKRVQALERNQFLLYSFFGFGSCLFSLVLWLNFLVPVSEPQTEMHTIVSYEKEWSYSKHSRQPRLDGYTLHLENGEYSGYPLTFVTDEPYHAGKVAFVSQRGMFGIRVLKGYYYVTEDTP